MTHKACDCQSCQTGHKYQMIRTALTPGLQSMLDDVYNELVEAQMDLSRVNALLDGEWPTAEEEMESKGWFRLNKLLESFPNEDKQ